MININTSRIKKTVGSFQIFSGIYASGKTVSMIKEAVNIFNEKESISIYAIDPYGDIRRVFRIDPLSEWCGITQEFRYKVMFVNDLSELPENSNESLIMIDAPNSSEISQQISKIMAINDNIMILMTKQVNRSVVSDKT